MGGNSDPFKNITNSTNKKVDDIKELFKTYAGQDLGNLDSETFELTDAAKTKYLGMDGTTKVGIHGGSLPFDPVPSNRTLLSQRRGERCSPPTACPIPAMSSPQS